MKKRKNFRKKPKANRMEGLQVDVYNNNIEGAFNVSANATSQIEFVKTVQNVFQPNSILIKLSSWLLKIFFSEL